MHSNNKLSVSAHLIPSGSDSPRSNAPTARSTATSLLDSYAATTSQWAPQVPTAAQHLAAPRSFAQPSAAAQPYVLGPAPARVPITQDGLAGRTIEISYKSDSAGQFPHWLASRMSPEEFRSVHRRLRSAYIKGRLKAARATGMVSALTCSLGTPIMVYATKPKVQKQRVRVAQEISTEFADRGVRIEVGTRSPVSIRMVLS